MHAKFWLNEKYIIITSANLSQMNLGIKKRKNFWRFNTEFFLIENNKELIKSAKEQFEKIFRISKNLNETLSTSAKAVKESKNYFDLFNMKSRDEAKILLGKFKLKFTIDSEKDIIRISKYASIIAKSENISIIEKEHVLMGGILLILQKRASTLREINEFLIEICQESDILNAIKKLLKKGLVELENEIYKINIEKLFLS